MAKERSRNSTWPSRQNDLSPRSQRREICLFPHHVRIQLPRRHKATQTIPKAGIPARVGKASPKETAPLARCPNGHTCENSRIVVAKEVATCKPRNPGATDENGTWLMPPPSGKPSPRINRVPTQR